MKKILIILLLAFTVSAGTHTLYFDSFDNLNFDVEYCIVHGNCTVYDQSDAILSNTSQDIVINLIPPQDTFLTRQYWIDNGEKVSNNMAYIIVALSFASMFIVLIMGVLSVVWTAR